jgi:hypothetical protein
MVDYIDFLANNIGLWLAAPSMILLLLTEFLSPQYGRINAFIDLEKMRIVAISLGFAFLVIVLIRILFIFNYI